MDHAFAKALSVCMLASLACGCASSGSSPGTGPAPAKVVGFVGSEPFSGPAAGLLIFAPNASHAGYASFSLSGGSASSGSWAADEYASLGELGTGDMKATVRSTYSDEIGAAVVYIFGKGVDAGATYATGGTLAVHINDDGTFSGSAACVPSTMSATFSGTFTATCYPTGAMDAGSVPVPDITWSSDFCKSFLRRRGTAP